MAITMNKFQLRITKFLVGTKERLNIYRKIASFMEQGIDLQKVLEKLSEQYEINKKGDPRGKMLKEWNESISAGRSLGITVSEWVPPSEAMIIKAGEKSGNPADAFRNATTITESSNAMMSTLKGEMGYPVVLLAMLMALIYMFSTEAVPQLTAVKDPSEWPAISYSLYEMSIFVQTKWWVVLVALFGSVYASVKSLPILGGPLRNILDRIPPWSIYKTFQSSAFLVSISAMLRTGIPIVDAIKETVELSEPYVKKELNKMLRKLETGTTVGKSLNSGFLDKETGMDVEIYAELKDLDKSIETIGLNAIENSIKTIKSAAALLKNIVLIGVTVYIGWVYYAFFTLTQSIGASAGGF